MRKNMYKLIKTTQSASYIFRRKEYIRWGEPEEYFYSPYYFNSREELLNYVFQDIENYKMAFYMQTLSHENVKRLLEDFRVIRPIMKKEEYDTNIDYTIVSYAVQKNIGQSDYISAPGT